MCGRFDVAASNREIDRLLAMLPPRSIPPRLGEVFPTANALTLVEADRQIVPRVMRWGFPKGDNKGVIFNARAETALSRPFFRYSLLSHPLAVPITGFYEWTTEQDRKIKVRFTDPASSVFYLAGFWRSFPESAQPGHFTILTTEANTSVLPFHHRMPILLTQAELSGWLSGQMRSQILKATPFPLSAAICDPARETLS